MENNEIIMEYYARFKEMPPIFVSISTDDEDYLRLVAKALLEGKKIDGKMFDEVFKNRKYDTDYSNDSFDETDDEDYEIGE